MRIVRTICLSLFVLALAPVGSAFASTHCSSTARSATLTRGSLASVTDYPIGARISLPLTSAPLASRKLHLGTHIYQFAQGGRISFGKNVITLGKHTTISLLCAAKTPGAASDRAYVRLFTGSVTLRTDPRHPGEVETPEALFTSNPGGPNRLTMKLTRNVASTSPQNMIFWFLDYTNQPKGITKVASHPGLDVTPYIGKGVGNCRYSTTRAILNAHGARPYGVTKKGGSGGGSVKYWKGHKKVA